MNTITLDHCKLEDENYSLQQWIELMKIPGELSQTLLKAQVVLVPQNFSQVNSVFMPSATELIARMKCQFGDGFEICATDENYKELSLYSHKLRLGHWFVLSVALPFAINIMSNYAYDCLKGETITENIIPQVDSIPQFQESTTLEVRITICDTLGRTKEFVYDGPANKFEETAKAINLDWND